ncbi:unnamed protein product, partial [Meganyctiphanes norvegica]
MSGPWGYVFLHTPILNISQNLNSKSLARRASMSGDMKHNMTMSLACRVSEYGKRSVYKLTRDMQPPFKELYTTRVKRTPDYDDTQQEFPQSLTITRAMEQMRQTRHYLRHETRLLDSVRCIMKTLIEAIISVKVQIPLGIESRQGTRQALAWLIYAANIKAACECKILCGQDVLSVFKNSMWSGHFIEAIVGKFGLVVITREGSNPYKFIYESDILTKHQKNIHIVTEWITNEVSSTKVRRALRRGESIKYLVQDQVIDFIYKHSLFNTHNK